jgi:hypothetical protein
LRCCSLLSATLTTHHSLLPSLPSFLQTAAALLPRMHRLRLPPSNAITPSDGTTSSSSGIDASPFASFGIPPASFGMPTSSPAIERCSGDDYLILLEAPLPALCYRPAPGGGGAGGGADSSRRVVIHPRGSVLCLTSSVHEGGTAPPFTLSRFTPPLFPTQRFTSYLLCSHPNHSHLTGVRLLCSQVHEGGVPLQWHSLSTPRGGVVSRPLPALFHPTLTSPHLTSSNRRELPRPISFHPILFHSVPSHPILFHPDPSRPVFS